MICHKKPYFLLLFSFFAITTAFGQGCSDAGFCTMGAMRPDQHYGKKIKIKLRSFEFNQYVGISRFGDVIHSTTAEFNLSITEKLGGQLKMPYTYMTGPLGNNQGTGDISLSLTHNIVQKYNYSISLSVGAKIPTTNGNTQRNEGVSLPMYYQTSLGTYDFIAGVSLITRKWLFATGYQQVIHNANENNFFWGPYKPLGLFEESQVYHPSIALERGRDIMFRVERNFRFSKFNLYLGLLDVWRLNRDKVTSPASGERVDVAGDEGTSNGHALTLLWGGGFHFTTKSSVKLLIGNRIIKRHFNPDGLSRELVLSAGYVFKF